MTISEDFIEVDTGRPVTGFNEVHDSEEFLKLNPYREIPVMVHAEVVLCESQAICQYITQVLGGPLRCVPAWFYGADIHCSFGNA